MSFAGVSLLVLLISSLSIFLLTPFAKRLGLIDVPNHRKVHVGNIPLIGGISIYAGLVIGFSMSVPPTGAAMTYLLCSSIIVALGVLDDAKDLSPKVRLFVQAMVAIMMCAGSQMYIHNLGDLVGLGGNVELGKFGYLLTVVAVIAAINAFNMIDGIDGLLGITSLVTFASMGLLFYLSNDMLNVYLTLIISVALLPYLMANLGISPIKGSKIFMGDTGSMLIGFTVVWLLIQGTQTADVSNPPSFSAATALWLIAFPLMDMVRVMVDRFSRGKSVFEADRSHLHHILQDVVGNSKRTTLLKICTLSVFFATVGIAMDISNQSEAIIFFVFLASFAVYSVRVRKLKSKRV